MDIRPTTTVPDTFARILKSTSTVSMPKWCSTDTIWYMGTLCETLSKHATLTKKSYSEPVRDLAIE
jgi:hypothetical protein